LNARRAARIPAEKETMDSEGKVTGQVKRE